MTLLSAIRSLLITPTAPRLTPVHSWQAPPPMTDDVLRGARALTARKVTCPSPAFLSGQQR